MLNVPYKDNQSEFLEKTAFELVFFLIINVLSLNIVFGIIIDTFADLRQIHSIKENDIKNVCFICH